MYTPQRIVMFGLMVLLIAGCYQAPLAALPALPAAPAVMTSTPTVASQATAQSTATGAAATTGPTTTAGAAQSTTAQPSPAPTPTASAPVTGGIQLKDALPSLSPQDVWQNFYDITQVPRPSGHMDQIRTFLVNFGKGLNLDTTVDDAGNVLIRKPAAKGMEDHAGVVLQAHMDMVAQKTADMEFDFLTDPIQAYVAGDWVHADDTTLGADNGIGIAVIMALLQRKDLVAPAIEALFTVDEETTMSGMNGLGSDELHGSDYINIDSEVEGQFTIGSAGGMTVRSSLAYQGDIGGPINVATAYYTVTVTGLTGGHSGIDINKGRGSATKLLVRLLWSAGTSYGVRLVSLQGGTAHNAIPTEANALVEMPVGEMQWFADYLKQSEMTMRQELAATEPNLSVKFITATLPMIQEVMTPASQQRVLDVLYANPQGVLRMSDSVPGLVETSNNLGVVTTENGFVKATNLARSSVDSELTDAGVMVMSDWDLAGGQYAVTDQYPGWNPNPNSLLLGLFERTYKQLYGVDASYVAIHAGLECGTVASKYPQMDLISLGPTLADVHSPTERLQVSTVPKAVDLLVDVLGQIPAE
jgi:dipeptidase D